MGVTEVLTIIFIVLKLLNKISWNWFVILLPEIIGVGFYLIIFILHTVLSLKLFKKIKK